MLDDFPFSDHPVDSFSSLSLHDTLPPFTEQDLLHPFMANLNEAVILSVKQRPPREPEPSTAPLAVKPVPPVKGSVMLHYYEKAKEAERKHLNSLSVLRLPLTPSPPLLSTTTEESSVSPMSHPSPRSSSVSETSRKSSFSGTADLSSVHQGELLILLQKISSLPNGVKRVNELQKQSREYNQKQQACRLARQECSEERVWNNAMDYVSPEEEMEFSYRPMVSMRLEYSSSESMMQEEAIASEASTPSSTSIPAPRLRAGAQAASRSNYPSFRVTLNSSLSGMRVDPLSLRSDSKGEALKESDQESSLIESSNPSRRSPSSMDHSIRFSSQSLEESIRRSLQLPASATIQILHQSQPLQSNSSRDVDTTNLNVSAPVGSGRSDRVDANPNRDRSNLTRNRDRANTTPNRDRTNTNSSRDRANTTPNRDRSDTTPSHNDPEQCPHSSASTSVQSTPHSPSSLRGRSQTSSPRPCSSEASQRNQNRLMPPPAGMYMVIPANSLYASIEKGKKYRPRVFSQQLKRPETRPSEMPRKQEERRTTLFPSSNHTAVMSRDSLLSESESPIPVDDTTSQPSLTNMSLDLGEPEGPVRVVQEQERPLSSCSAFSRSRRKVLMSQSSEAPNPEMSLHLDTQHIVIPERSQSDVIHPSVSVDSALPMSGGDDNALDDETVNELDELLNDSLSGLL